MDILLLTIICAVVALLATMIAYPFVLRFARKHNIVDNPNARKLQRVPVPVMGGVAVYFGVLCGGLFLCAFAHTEMLLTGFLVLTLMLVIGVWDDVKDISATFRFIVEIILVSAVMAITEMYIDSFHGLCGIENLSMLISLPLSLVAGVGIINAVNLIDGVDGYSSGFGVLACTCFAVLFFCSGKYVMGCFAVIAASSLIPFFLHNVFGKKSKMFIGDGGTLMLGMLMTVFCFSTLSSQSWCTVLAKEYGLGLVPFALAVLAIPVFDTLRVMTARIVRGRSPFSPDKTHLHHLFIDMGYSHIGAALSILAIAVGIICIWLVSWLLGASVTTQFIIVVLLGLAVTFGFYKFMKLQQYGGDLDMDGDPVGTPLWHWFNERGRRSHYEKSRFWGFMTKVVDSRFFGGE